MKLLDMGERLVICKVRYAARAILLWAVRFGLDTGVHDVSICNDDFFEGDPVIDKEWLTYEHLEMIEKRLRSDDDIWMSGYLEHAGPFACASIEWFPNTSLTSLKLNGFVNPGTRCTIEKSLTEAEREMSEIRDAFVDFYNSCDETTLRTIERIFGETHEVRKPGKSDAITRLEKPEDPVNHPSHYISNGIEVIDVIEAFTKDCTGMEAVCVANALKYICRWKHKNGIEDLKKARWYLDRLIEGKEGE